MAVVGAVAIALSATGLLLDAVRPGPLDVELTPANVMVDASGSYLATGANTGPLGICAMEPCTPRTRIALELVGLYPGTYEARLEGPGSTVPLGAFAARSSPGSSAQVLAFDRAEDHTDKTRLVLLHAGYPLYAWEVRAGELSLTGSILTSFGFEPIRVHLDEIGAVSVSTTAKSTLSLPPPPGAAFVVYLESGTSSVAMGTFEPMDGVLVLDGRVERLRLGDQERVTVYLAGAGTGGGPGVPVWSGLL